MQAEVIDLTQENGRITGVRAKTSEGMVEIRAKLTIGADGRHSVVRERAGLQVMDLGAPMDVFWMRFSRRQGDPEQALGHVEPGKMFVMIDREDYWQCAFVIPKGAADAGASIFPIIPAFYYRPASLDDMAREFAYRVLAHLGLPQPQAFRWKG